MSLLDTLRSSSENGLARDASVSDPSLDQLRAGDMLDYDGSTWTVTRHERFDHEEGSVDRWTLTCGDDTRLLEHGPGGADFRLFRRATPADVAVEGQPLLKAVRDGKSINPIEYRGARYELPDTDVRTGLEDKQEVRLRSARSLMRAQLDRKFGGVFGGLGAYLGVPSVLLRVVVLLGVIELLAAGIFVWEFSPAVWGAVALAMVSAYGGAVLVLPSAPLSMAADAALSRYGLYKGEEGAVILECWGKNDWRAYEGRAASPDEFENILPGERRQEETEPEARIGTALRRLQEGGLVDHEGSTWEVTRHTRYEDEDGKGSVNQWTLQHGTVVQILEHEENAGPIFRLSTSVPLAEVTIDGQPFLKAVSDEDSPSSVAYQGTEYVLAEEDVRMSSTGAARQVDFWTRSRTDDKLAGVLGGIAEQTDGHANFLRAAWVAAPAILSVVSPTLLDILQMEGQMQAIGCMGPVPAFFAMYLLFVLAMPKAPPEPSEGDQIRFWRYESDDEFIVLECRGKNEWSAHAGREVAPHVFENVLPEPEKGFLATLWDRVSVSTDSTPTELLGGTALQRLREDYLLDYNLQTWTVTEHTKYPYEGWPSDVWTLESEGDEQELEYDPREGGTFRLFEHVPVGPSFVETVERDGAPLDEIEYEDTQYVLTERDARVHEEGRLREGEENHINFLARSLVDRWFLGICGGIAKYRQLPSGLVRLVPFLSVIFLSVLVALLLDLFGGPVLAVGSVLLPMFVIASPIMIWVFYHVFARSVPEAPPRALSHYWVYESDDGDLLAIRCEGGEWTARVGREVEPHEFDNILPPSER